MPRSDMFQMVWWVASVCRETKSQKVSCALWRSLHVRGQERGLTDRLRGAVGLEDAVRGRAAGVDHTLGDPLVVEVHELFTQVVVLQQYRPPGARLERVVRVRQAHPLRRGQVCAALRHPGLVRAGGLPGRADRLRAALVRLRRQRLHRRRRLDELRRDGGRFAGDPVPRALCRAGVHDVGDFLSDCFHRVLLGHLISRHRGGPSGPNV